MSASYSFVLLAALLRISACSEWCYESQFSCEHVCYAPEEWTHVSETCGGLRQSPINIVTKKVTASPIYTSFQFQGYQDTFHGTLTNNGHTVKVSLPGTATISGGQLGATYKAMEFHFHWGKNGEPGSEHTIDGEQYPMEMHIVHIRQDFNTVTEAVTSPTGLAVLGFFFEESASANNKYDPIITKLQNVIHSGNTSAIDIVSLDSLIPSHNALNKYFRYNGSLTTPNCQESVIWTVFENPIQLSKAQLSEFSRLQFESGIPMTGTFRPTQPLYGRKVYYSGCNVPSLSGTNNLKYGVDYSGSHVTTGSTILVISAVLTAFLTRSE